MRSDDQNESTNASFAQGSGGSEANFSLTNAPDKPSNDRDPLHPAVIHNKCIAPLKGWSLDSKDTRIPKHLRGR